MSVLGDAFELSIVISAVDKFTRPMKDMESAMKYSKQNMDMITKSMKAMGSSSSEIDKVSKAMDRVARNKAFEELAKDMREAGAAQKDIDRVAAGMERLADQQERFKKAQKTTAIGAAITGFGVLSLDMLAKAAQKASELQIAITSVGSAMKLNAKEMQDFGGEAMTLGVPTKFSAVQVSDILKAMYTAGLAKDQIFNKDIASQYVNFADIQEYVKNENGADAVSNAVGMAHQYQLYTGQQIAPFLNDLNAILVNSHQTMSEFATQYNYVAGQAKRSGVSSTDALDITAWLSRMGFGSGRGGTNFADFLQRSYYHSSGDKADAAMEAAGFIKDGRSVFYDAKGSFVGITKASEIMQDFYKRYGNNMNKINPILEAIWGTQGGRIAGTLGSNGAVEQWNTVKNSVSGTADIKSMQETMNMTLGGQWTQFTSTIHDLVQVFGQQLIPIFTSILAFVNKILKAILDFAIAHPEIVKLAAILSVVATAAALIIGPIVAVIGVIGMLTVATGALDLALAPIILIALAVAAALAAIGYAAYEVYKHWPQIKAYMKPVVDWMVQTMKPLIVDVMDTAKSAFKKFKDTAGPIWEQLKTDIMAFWNWAGPYMKFYAKATFDTLKLWFELLIPVAKFVFDLIVGIIKLAFDNISSIILVSLDLLHGDFSKAWTDMQNGWKTMADDTQGTMSTLGGDIQSIVSSWGPALADYAVNIAKDFGSSFGSEMKSQVWLALQHASIAGHSLLDMLPQSVQDAIKPDMTSAPSTSKQGIVALAHADGGIYDQPHFGVFAEAGAEAWIPLTNKKRGLEVWKQAGAALGVDMSGGRGGDTYNSFHIYQQPGQSADELAEIVIRKMQRNAKMGMRSAGTRVNINSI